MKKRKAKHKEMSFLDHLEELRWRLWKCLGAAIVFIFAAFPFTGKILELLTYPNTRLKNPATFIFLKPTGMLMLRMEIAMIVGLIAASPVILYQLWQFIAPGLYPKERKFIAPIILITIICFLLGAGFAYAVLIPIVLPFLFSLSTASIQPMININDYAQFVLRLILLTGLVFELPMVSFLLTRLGLLTPKFLRKAWKYSILFIFIFAAIVTPPDPVSQIILALPLVLLYEVSIWVSQITIKKKKSN